MNGPSDKKALGNLPLFIEVTMAANVYKMTFILSMADIVQYLSSDFRQIINLSTSNLIFSYYCRELYKFKKLKVSSDV